MFAVFLHVSAISLNPISLHDRQLISSKLHSHLSLAQSSHTTLTRHLHQGAAALSSAAGTSWLKRQSSTLSSTCLDFYNSANDLMQGDECAFQQLFTDLDSPALSDVAKAEAVTEYCASNCTTALRDAVEGIIETCDLTDEEEDGATDLLHGLRDLLGVVCVANSDGEYCFTQWLKFGAAMEATDGITEAASLAEEYCDECLSIVFKRSLEFAAKRGEETEEQLKERLRGIIGTKLFCSRSYANPDDFCVVELGNFVDDADAGAGDTGETEYISGLVEQICSTSGCLPRLVYADKYFTDSPDDAESLLLKLNGICTRDPEGNLCFTQGFTKYYTLLTEHGSVDCNVFAGNADGVSCPADSVCREKVTELMDDLGCCTRSFLHTIATIDDEQTEAERQEGLDAQQKFLEFATGKCEAEDYEACRRATMTMNVRYTNIHEAYYNGNREEIIEAMRKDFAGNAGVDLDDVVVLESGVVAGDKRSDGAVDISFELAPRYSEVFLDGLGTNMLAHPEEYAAGQTAQHVNEDGRVDPMSPFAVSQEGDATVALTAGVDFFPDASTGAAETLKVASAALAVLAAVHLA